MVCITKKCDRNTRPFVLDAREAIVPTDCEIGKLRSLFSYFQYKSPNIDSIHSPLLEEAFHDDILQNIMKGNENYHFCAHTSNTDDELKKIALYGSSVCSKCKRFFCKRSGSRSKREPNRKESDLECLLRHLRNSIAHGHVYIAHGGNFISVCFEDINTDKKTTARIVCTQADLIRWKGILEKALSNRES